MSGPHSIGCYLDINNDRYIDVAVYNEKTITIFSWKNDNDPFEKWGSWDVDYNVKEMIAGNFGGKFIDLLIIMQPDAAESNAYIMQIWTLEDATFKLLDTMVNSLTNIKLDTPSVLLFDSRADMKMDMLYKQSKSDEFKILQSNTNNSYTFLQNYNNVADKTTLSMNSIAWIDIDQDCHGDLVFAMQNKLYYIAGGSQESYKNSDSYWKLINDNNDITWIKIIASNIDLTQYDMDSILFADFDSNGSPDILLRHSTQLKLVLLLQKNSHKSENSLCNGALTVEMSRVDVDLSSLNFNFKDKSGKSINVNQYYKWPSNINDINTVMMTADIDFDDNMEILMLLERNSSVADAGIDIIFCYFDSHSKELVKSEIDSESSKYRWKSINQMSLYHNDDLMEGYYYLVVNGIHSTNLETKFMTINWRGSAQSRIKNEHYYLSVCPLRSAKDSSIGDSKGKYEYIDFFNGVTVKIYFHNDVGHSVYLGAFIKYQTNSKTLLLPCALIGLATTNNYIESLKIGYSFYSSKTNYHVFRQPGVPPKTKLYIFPNPGKDPQTWILESFLSPAFTWQVLAGFVTGICIVLGALLVYFDQKQRKANQKESEIENPANRFFF